MNPLLVTVQWLVAASYPLAVAYAVVSDVRRLEIPNWTCITIAAAFLPAALFRDIDYFVIAGHYGIGGLLFIAGMILFARNLAGGGDMKLLAAAGVWIGWADLLAYLALVALLGGVLALAVLAARRYPAVLPFLSSLWWMKGDAAKTQPIPYGVAIGVAAVLLLSRNPAIPPSWAAALAW